MIARGEKHPVFIILFSIWQLLCYSNSPCVNACIPKVFLLNFNVSNFVNQLTSDKSIQTLPRVCIYAIALCLSSIISKRKFVSLVIC